MGCLMDQVDVYEQAMEYLQLLVGQKLDHGFKASDFDLFDLGFGKLVGVTNCKGKKRIVNYFVLHVMCGLRLIHKSDPARSIDFSIDTLREDFDVYVEKLKGAEVKRVRIRRSNDLWIDLGEYWMIAKPFLDDEESWCYFTFEEDSPYLAASSQWLEMRGKRLWTTNQTECSDMTRERYEYSEIGYFEDVLRLIGTDPTINK